MGPIASDREHADVPPVGFCNLLHVIESKTGPLLLAAEKWIEKIGVVLGLDPGSIVADIDGDLPLIFRRIDSPVFFFTAGNSTSYTRSSGNE